MKLREYSYLVMVSQDGELDHSVVNPFWETAAICNTVKKAYRIGAWLAGVNDPDHTYRKTADTLREQGVVYISSKEDPEETRIVIAKVKNY